ncbi:MAG: peptidoglycan DD-metalloendopeptidase family protein [Pseudomonadota bacterium]
MIFASPLKFWAILAAALAPLAATAQTPTDLTFPDQAPAAVVAPSVLAKPADLAAGDPFAGRSWLYGHEIEGQLFTLDFEGLDTDSVGPTFEEVTDIATHADGRQFGVSFTHLLRLDRSSGLATEIGTGLGFRGVNALDFSPDGRLFAATTRGEFLQVDTVTGLAKLIGFYGSGLGSAGDLAFDRNGNLYASISRFGNDSLAQVNAVTGAATMIGSIGFRDVYGLAFGPTDRLYGVGESFPSSTPILISIDTQSGAGTAIGPITGRNEIGGFASRRILSPMVGAVRVNGPAYPDPDRPLTANGDCRHQQEVWTACQHQTGFHHPTGGIAGTNGQGADESYSWDFNLFSGGVVNSDAGRPVYAIAEGKVVRYSGNLAPGERGNSGIGSSAVLVEHGTACNVTPNDCWWSGYLHMSDISVELEQRVNQRTQLGLISDLGSPGVDHLHFVIYQGRNIGGGLVSVDAAIAHRPRVAPTVAQPPVMNLLLD